MASIEGVEAVLDPKFVGALVERKCALSQVLPLAYPNTSETTRALALLRRLFNLRAQEPTSEARGLADLAFHDAVEAIVRDFCWEIPDTEAVVGHAAEVMKRALVDHCGRCLLSYVAVERDTGLVLDFQTRTVTRGVAEGKRELRVVTDEERRPGQWRCDDCGRFLGGWASE
jgi:hypothetical protein